MSVCVNISFYICSVVSENENSSDFCFIFRSNILIKNILYIDANKLKILNNVSY